MKSRRLWVVVVIAILLVFLRPVEVVSGVTVALIGEGPVTIDWIQAQLSSPQFAEDLSQLASLEKNSNQALASEFAFRLQPEGRLSFKPLGEHTLEIRVRAKSRLQADWTCKSIPTWLQNKIASECKLRARNGAQLSMLAGAEEHLVAAEARLSNQPGPFADNRYQEAYGQFSESKHRDQSNLQQILRERPELIILEPVHCVVENQGFASSLWGKR